MKHKQPKDRPKTETEDMTGWPPLWWTQVYSYTTHDEPKTWEEACGRCEFKGRACDMCAGTDSKGIYIEGVNCRSFFETPIFDEEEIKALEKEFPSA